MALSRITSSNSNARVTCLRSFLGIDLNGEVVAEHAAAVQHVNSELLSQRVRLIAHHDANSEVAHLGIFGNCARTGQRLRQAANNQTQRILVNARLWVFGFARRCTEQTANGR